jgi:hypothetical protein
MRRRADPPSSERRIGSVTSAQDFKLECVFVGVEMSGGWREPVSEVSHNDAMIPPLDPAKPTSSNGYLKLKQRAFSEVPYSELQLHELSLAFHLKMERFE